MFKISGKQVVMIFNGFADNLNIKLSHMGHCKNNRAFFTVVSPLAADNVGSVAFRCSLANTFTRTHSLFQKPGSRRIRNMFCGV